MDSKAEVVEKGVKPTVIRRRAKVETPAPEPAEKPSSAEAAPSASAPAQISADEKLALNPEPVTAEGKAKAALEVEKPKTSVIESKAPASKTAVETKPPASPT